MKRKSEFEKKRNEMALNEAAGEEANCRLNDKLETLQKEADALAEALVETKLITQGQPINPTAYYILNNALTRYRKFKNEEK